MEDPLLESPSKRKLEVINPSPSPQKSKFQTIDLSEEDLARGIKSTALKRGIIKIDPNTGKVSPLKSSPGRSRWHYDYIDRLAKKRAFLTANPGLDPNEGLIEISDDDIEIAEKIIAGSRSESSTPQSRRIGSFFNNGGEDQFESLGSESFLETPIPSPRETEEILEKYSTASTLAKGAESLFLDGPEGYFEQHKFKGKASGNTLSQAPVLDHEEQAEFAKLSDIICYAEKESLKNEYYGLFTQFYFELSEGFSLIFYGIGSKRQILIDFAESFLQKAFPVPVIFVNGYNPSTSAREIVESITKFLVPKSSLAKFPRNPFEAMPLLEKYKSENPSTNNTPECIVVVHNIDGESLRSEKVQLLLAQLASIKSVYFICSVDHINAPLLWDSSKSTSFKYAWHDITTYDSYTVENAFQNFHLIGKSSKNIGLKGVEYVLSSLTQNARNLYQVLASNQLQSLMEEDSGKNVIGSVRNGVEFKQLYNQCAQEFIASNEVSFRIMLREFIEHDMAGIAKNSSGTEIVFVPLTTDELEELMVGNIG